MHGLTDVELGLRIFHHGTSLSSRTWTASLRLTPARVSDMLYQPPEKWLTGPFSVPGKPYGTGWRPLYVLSLYIPVGSRHRERAASRWIYLLAVIVPGFVFCKHGAGGSSGASWQMKEQQTENRQSEAQAEVLERSECGRERARDQHQQVDRRTTRGQHRFRMQARCRHHLLIRVAGQNTRCEPGRSEYVARVEITQPCPTTPILDSVDAPLPRLIGRAFCAVFLMTSRFFRARRATPAPTLHVSAHKQCAGSLDLIDRF